MSTLSQLTTPLTAAEVNASIYSGLATSGITTTGWKPGAVIRTIIAVVAVVLAAFSGLIALIARAGFLELSTGAWLDAVAYYVYDLERIPSTFATGYVTLTNTGGGAFIGVGVGDLIVAHGTNGNTYRSTEAFSLASWTGVGAQPTVRVAVRAEALGTGSNAVATEINTLVTTFTGVTCSNALALVGADAELDPALRTRCRAKLGVLSPNGPVDAYTFAALSARRADGSFVGVTRVKMIADGVGGVDVYVADTDGSLTGTVGDEATDLGIIDRDIQRDAVPTGITGRVHAATPKTLAVTYELWIRDTSGATDVEIKDAIEDALVAFMAARPIGGDLLPATVGKVYVSAIEAAITAAEVAPASPGRLPLPIAPYVIRVVVTSPAADVSIATTEAPALDLVTPTVHQIAG